MNSTHSNAERDDASVSASEEPEVLLTANVSVVSLYEPDERVLDTRTKMRGLVPGVITLAMGITIVVLSAGVRTVKDTPLGPPFWPTMIGWGAIALGIVLLIFFFTKGLKWGDVPEPISSWGASRLIASAVILVGYLLLWSVLQFWASTLIVSLALVALYGARNWKTLVFFPIGITALLHFLFVVALGVPL